MRPFKRIGNRRGKARRPGGSLRLEWLEQRRLMTTVCGDFNADGFDDLAVAAPYDDVGGQADAGSVSVIYGSPSGPRADAGPGNQLWHQNSPGIHGGAEKGDHFGSALAVGDCNMDGIDDLAISAAGEDLEWSTGLIPDAGVVHVIYGSLNAGLDAHAGPGNQVWHQNSPDILGGAEEGDGFGWALTAGDFDGNGADDLGVGVPFEDIEAPNGLVEDAGVVNVIYGYDIVGLDAANNQVWHQNYLDIYDVAEKDDHFGWSLAAGDLTANGCADLIVGAPDEDVADGYGEVQDAGAVNVIHGAPKIGLDTASGTQFWSQLTLPGELERSDHFGWSVAAGNFNGDSRNDILVGVPFEDLPDNPDPGWLQDVIIDAGAVNVIYSWYDPSSQGAQFLHQDSPGIPGKAEDYDYFGWSVATGDFNYDGFDDGAIGVPWEDIGQKKPDAGAVDVLFGNSGLTAGQLWHRNKPGIVGTAKPLDMLGMSLP